MFSKVPVVFRMIGYLPRLLLGRLFHVVQGSFSYHRRSSAMPLTFMMVFIAPAGIFLVAIVIPWPALTWVMAVILGYALVYTASLYASMIALPHKISNNTLVLRYGAIASATIHCSLIKSAVISREWFGQTGDGLKLGWQSQPLVSVLGVPPA